MSNLIEHAKEELTRAGLFADDSDYGGMLGDAVLELISVFAGQGHSGMSAEMVTDIFSRLARYQTLTSLTDDPTEWMQVEMGKQDCWQSRRRPDAFSLDGGKTYYLLDEEPRVIHDSAVND